jgi:hypothetical protein
LANLPYYIEVYYRKASEGNSLVNLNLLVHKAELNPRDLIYDKLALSSSKPEDIYSSTPGKYYSF